MDVVAVIFCMFPNRVLEAEARSLHMMENPGQTMNDDSELGMAREIARKIVKRASIPHKKSFVPWARVVKTVENSANEVIIPFSRTPNRNKRFTWIAELYPLQFGFVSLKAPVDSFKAALKLKRLGVWRATSMEEELRVEGF